MQLGVVLVVGAQADTRVAVWAVEVRCEGEEAEDSHRSSRQCFPQCLAVGGVGGKKLDLPMVGDVRWDFRSISADTVNGDIGLGQEVLGNETSKAACEARYGDRGGGHVCVYRIGRMIWSVWSLVSNDAGCKWLFWG